MRLKNRYVLFRYTFENNDIYGNTLQQSINIPPHSTPPTSSTETQTNTNTNTKDTETLSNTKLLIEKDQTSSKKIQKQISKHLESQFGDTALGLTNLHLKYTNPHTQTCILRVSRDSIKNTLTALNLVNTIDAKGKVKKYK